MPPVIENGLSAKANHCLFRAGVSSGAIGRHERNPGALRPGKRPANYGKQTHAGLLSLGGCSGGDEMQFCSRK